MTDYIKWDDYLSLNLEAGIFLTLSFATYMFL